MVIPCSGQPAGVVAGVVVSVLVELVSLDPGVVADEVSVGDVDDSLGEVDVDEVGAHGVPVAVLLEAVDDVVSPVAGEEVSLVAADVGSAGDVASCAESRPGICGAAPDVLDDAVDDSVADDDSVAAEEDVAGVELAMVGQSLGVPLDVEGVGVTVTVFVGWCWTWQSWNLSWASCAWVRAAASLRWSWRTAPAR